MNNNKLESITITEDDLKLLGISEYWHKLIEINKSCASNLLNEIAIHYGTTLKNACSKKRTPKNVKSRRLYMVLAYLVLMNEKEFIGRSLESIALDVGLKSHSTVKYHLKEFELECLNYKDTRDSIIFFAETRLSQDRCDKLVKYINKLESKTKSHIKLR